MLFAISLVMKIILLLLIFLSYRNNSSDFSRINQNRGFPGGSEGKESVCNAGNPWVKKIPWRREWQPIPVFLPGELHGQRSLVATVHGVTKRRTQQTDSHTHKPSLKDSSLPIAGRIKPKLISWHAGGFKIPVPTLPLQLHLL